MTTVYDIDALQAENASLRKELAKVNHESEIWQDFAVQLRLSLKKAFDGQYNFLDADTLAGMSAILDATQELEGEKPWYLTGV